MRFISKGCLVSDDQSFPNIYFWSSGSSPRRKVSDSLPGHPSLTLLRLKELGSSFHASVLSLAPDALLEELRLLVSSSDNMDFVMEERSGPVSLVPLGIILPNPDE